MYNNDIIWIKKIISPIVILFTFVLYIPFLQLNAQQPKLPGVVVDHIPALTKIYIGSPSLCIMPDGSYIASHDYFGPGSTEFQIARTSVFKSVDNGKSWGKISEINGQFWSNLFVHKNVLYIIGTWKHHGSLIIRRSSDGGISWSEPTDGTSGLLLEGEYHTAPMPVIIHNNRLWRAIENAKSCSSAWGRRYSAMMISAPVDADLLNASSWRVTNSLPADSTYLNGKFIGWLEGNAVITPDGKIIDFLRVATSEKGRDMAALVNITEDGSVADFNPSTGFLDFAGGARKFSIRYDEKSQLYWTISNMVAAGFSGLDAGSVRNTLILKSSADLINWNINKVLLFHPDVKKHGFQYVDWQFDGSDIIFLSRTAYDDDSGGANNYHDANWLTFHRIRNFRRLSKSHL